MTSILVIDDNDEFRGMLRKMLEKEGYEVREARHGKEGVELYRENPADLLMIDLIMPEEDGVQVMSELKKEFNDIKFIMMSGGGEYESGEDYLSSLEAFGVQKTLAKPFDRQTMIAMVKEALEK